MISITPENHKYLDAAKLLKEMCRNTDFCDDCVFVRKGFFNPCMFAEHESYPDAWNLESIGEQNGN